MPRKYLGRCSSSGATMVRFNEAGADAPEIPLQSSCIHTPATSSMRPGRMPRKYHHILTVAWHYNISSMRPGRMPRKYLALRISSTRNPVFFNEAGADAPEIPTSCSLVTIKGFALQ